MPIVMVTAVTVVMVLMGLMAFHSVAAVDGIIGVDGYRRCSYGKVEEVMAKEIRGGDKGAWATWK
ncbi:hypothetical protein AOQ84DRAFT_111767 [Glonium stellatum]|uniref:Uncharacterized protein n=1 Tax=Glonium stellatum TaxID=574774 RepID=A0A8E2ETQ3_9PEZI|nr:hypothetical protein AOQ84DRAFT_111767 [Glonium stellatum]